MSKAHRSVRARVYPRSSNENGAPAGAPFPSGLTCERLGARAAATLRGEEPDAAGEREAADQREHPGVEARAGEGDALDATAADPGDVRTTDTDVLDVVVLVVHAVDITGANAAIDVVLRGEVLLLVAGRVGVTTGVLLDQAGLVAGVATAPGLGILVDLAVLVVVARRIAVLLVAVLVGDGHCRHRGEHGERHKQHEYLRHSFLL